MLKKIASCVFHSITAARNLSFDCGLRKVKQLKPKVISVGNISMGGTGKTPVVQLIANSLKSSNKVVAILSRGYGGNYKDRAVQVKLGKANATSIYGDEPVLHAEQLSIPVYVARKRYDVHRIIDPNIEVIVADDAFQHRQLHRDIDIVLIDATDDKNELAPLGRMRESFSSIERADIVILTKWDLANLQQQERLKRKLNKFGMSLNNPNLYVLNYTVSAINKTQKNQNEFSDKLPTVLCSAIAQPQSFYKLMETKSKIVDHVIRADHHPWSKNEIDKLYRKYSNAQIVLTTKDFVKIEPLMDKIYENFFVCEIALDKQAGFNLMRNIEKRLKK